MKKLKSMCSPIIFITFLMFFNFEGLNIKCKADINDSYVGVTYNAHIQNIGWQNLWCINGEEAGTDGKSLRMEALKINLTNAPADARILYQAHVQNLGWQQWVNDGNEAGTDGKGLRMEALRVKLLGMPDYSVEYQAHVQNLGWQNWVKDGEEAGTDGKGLRIEAIRIKIINKVHPDSITLNKSNENLALGNTDKLSVTFSPDNTTDKNVTWNSSDSNTVSVDKDGNITALREGTANITATSVDGKKNTSCFVTVVKAEN
ncbi:hypothetical protein NL50_17575 [Clostridium acetobutylicum]|nr:hypothetical protein NL50_17575 [Clostridium acetobutylicum]